MSDNRPSAPKPQESGTWWTAAVVAAVLLLAAVLALVWVADRGDPVENARSTDRIAPELGQLPSSSVTVPIRYEPDSLLRRLEEAVPRRFGSLSEPVTSPARPHVRYAFEAERRPFRVSFPADSIRLHTTLSYQGDLSYVTAFGPLASAACRGSGSGTDTVPRARVRLASPLRVNSDWTVDPSIDIEDMTPIGDGRCTLSVLGVQIDATGLILSSLRAGLANYIEEMEAVLSGWSLRDRAEDFWSSSQRPHRLAEEDLWFTLRARGLHYGVPASTASDSASFQAQFGLEARPRVTLGERPLSEPVPLPPLNRTSSAQQRQGPDSIRIEGRAHYGTLARRTEALLRDRTFELPIGSVRVARLDLRGLGRGRLLVEAGLTGSLEGTVRAVGTPVLEPDRGRISVPDLDFTLESGGFFARSGAWIVRTFFLEEMRRRAQWEIGTVLPWGGPGGTSRSIDVPLAGGAVLEGRLDPLRITDLVAADSAVVVRARTRAAIRVRSTSSPNGSVRSVRGTGP